MKYVTETLAIFARYDLYAEIARQDARQVSRDAQLQRVADGIIEGDDDEVEEAVEAALESKNPLEVIADGLVAGMQEVGRLWDEGVYFLPQVILSSDAMSVGVALCEKKMGKPMEKKAKVVTHTAEGDVHDIGQVIVNALLNANGFDVIDLGVDVPVDDVVKACKHHRPVMLSGTALMTTTMTAFPKIAIKLKEEGLNIPFICGGGAVNEEYVTSFDLGIWGKEASQAPGMAEDALEGLSWQEMRAKWNG